MRLRLSLVQRQWEKTPTKTLPVCPPAHSEDGERIKSTCLLSCLDNLFS